MLMLIMISLIYPVVPVMSADSLVREVTAHQAGVIEYRQSPSKPTLTNCAFIENTANSNGRGGNDSRYASSLIFTGLPDSADRSAAKHTA